MFLMKEGIMLNSKNTFFYLLIPSILRCPVWNCFKQFKKEFSKVKIEAYTTNIVNIYSFEKAWKLKTTLIKNTEMKVFGFI